MIDLKNLLKQAFTLAITLHVGIQKCVHISGAHATKTHLINVAKTAFLLDRAETFLTSAAASGKDILWVGTKKPAQSSIVKVAQSLSMPSVSHRWIGGTLSNFDQVKKAITRLLHLRDVREKSIARYTKKEQSMIVKEIERLEKNIGGIVDMKNLPAALVVVDAKKERSAIKEANTMGIPVICLVDTNTDPSGVSYLIPSNDDSPRSIDLILNTLAAATQKGIAEAKANAEKTAKAAAAEKEAKKKATADKKEASPAKPASKAANKKGSPKTTDAKDSAAKDAPKKAPAKKAPAAKAAANKPATPKKTAAKKPTAKKEVSK